LLLQGEDLKERVIDDYRRSLVNSAFASRSYLELQDVDVLAAMITMVMQLVAEGPLRLSEAQRWDSPGGNSLSIGEIGGKFGWPLF
jgi:hypothetical protein